MKRHPTDALLLGALLLITVVRGLLWMGTYPAFKTPDEPSHFDNIQYRGEHGGQAPVPHGKLELVVHPGMSPEVQDLWKTTNKLFRKAFSDEYRSVREETKLRELARDQPNRMTNGQSTASQYPGFYYAIGSLAYDAFKAQSVLNRLFAIRLYSLLWGLLLVASTFVAARLCLDSRALAFAAGLFATLQPLAAQQTISVNNDSAVIALAALGFALQLTLLVRREPPTVALVATLTAVVALAMETKPQGIVLLPGTLVFGAIAILRAPYARRTWRLIGAGALSFAFCFLVCRLALDRADSEGSLGLVLGAKAPTVFGFVKFLGKVEDEFFVYLFDSAWGHYCWLDVRLGDPWFEALHDGGTVFVLGLAAAVTQALLLEEDELSFRLRPLVLAASTAVLGFLLVLFAEYFGRTALATPHVVQGRAFLIVLAPCAILGAVAAGALVPRRFHTLVACFAVVSMSALAAGALITVATYQYAN